MADQTLTVAGLVEAGPGSPNPATAPVQSRLMAHWDTPSASTPAQKPAPRPGIQS